MRLLRVTIISFLAGTAFCAPIPDSSLDAPFVKRWESDTLMNMNKRTSIGSESLKRDVLLDQTDTPHPTYRRDSVAKQVAPNGVPSPQYRRSNFEQAGAPDGVPSPQI